jgi:Lhr-like helicase
MPINPIAVVREVIDEYKSHIRTEFRARDKRLREALERELDAPGFLAQAPFFQAHRPFRAGKPWAELGLDAKLARVLEERSHAKTAFLHQSEAISHLLGPDATPTVVTTGTGSGKTECFLAPVIQNAIEDATRFRRSGLTAILVYPMNALANDQEARIASYLESSGHTYVKVGRYDRSTKAEQREQWRAEPPHILLTNYVMLEYLLVRPADRDGIFANHRCKFLVLDEVHSYRGALGVNIALLIRRVAAHLAGARQDWSAQERDARRFPRLIHVATSATIKSVDETGKTQGQVTALRDEAVQGFLSTLIGCESKSIRVIGESLRDLEVPAEAGWPAAPAMISTEDLTGDHLKAAVAALAGMSAETQIETSARKAAILWKLNQILVRRPLSLDDLAKRVREEVPERAGASQEAVRAEVEAALVIGATLPDDCPGVLRLRAHRLVRGGWRFFRCVDPACGRLYPMGQETCSCGRRTAPLYICRSCGTDTLRFREDDAGQLVPNDSRANEGEWLLYDQGRIDDAEGGDDVELETDREMKGRKVKVGSFDPVTLSFSERAGDYPVRGILAPGRNVCLVCGGTAGAKDVLTPVSLGTSAAVRVLAEGLLEGLAAEHAKSEPEPDRKERLLIFADSRQDAAHQARFITYAGRYDRMRRRVYEILARGQALSVQRLTEELLTLGVDRHDNPLVSRQAKAAYLSDQIKQKAIAWEEAPLLDEISITGGFRATLLNLGLVGVRYQHLDKWMADAGGELAGQLGVNIAQLAFLARSLLDEMRKRGALSRSMLTYNPAHANFPETLAAADWERRLKWPTGYPCSDDGTRPLASLDSDTLPHGIAVQGLWRPDKTGGRGPAIQRRLKELLRRMKGAEPSRDQAVRLVELLMGGPMLIAPTKLYGTRETRLLLQVNADCVLLECLGDDDRYRCSICNVRMPWVAAETPCPGCRDGVLRHWAPADVQASRYVERIVHGTLIPLVAGEHTAQVTGDRRIELEDDFKGPASRSALNVLACSPTMEMGIDVGGLDAVMLRNVPPRPDNYAQRGGRAGRRTRVGIVMGYARNTPHDGYFYDKPAEMIAGEVPAPSIGLGNRDVTLRHLYAMVFGAAEPGLAGRMEVYIDTQGNLKEDAVTALIQGLEAKFDHAVQLALSAWGPDVRKDAGLGSETEIRAALAELPAKVRDLFARVRFQIVQIEQTIQTNLALLRNKPVGHAMELKRRLLGIRDSGGGEADDRTSGHPLRRFAEFGILPGYEFPAEPCTLRLFGDPSEDQPIAVERRFGLAQYQPEAKAHARGHRWRVAGLDLASPWNPKSPDPDWVYSVCKNCRLRYGTQEHTRCPRCESDATIANGLPAHSYGGFLAVRDDTPVLEEEDRHLIAALVQAHPQHDGHPVFHYHLPTDWFAELRRGETIRWLNEWKIPTAKPGSTAPFLHSEARGFYLCPDCGRILEWPDQGGKKKKGRAKPVQGDADPYKHGTTCTSRGQPPVPCAITTSGTATTLRIYIDLPPEWSGDDYSRWGYSLGFALRTGMRQLYMLDGPEIDFSLELPWERTEGRQKRKCGALTFMDSSVGGSGFLEKTASELHLVAKRALEHLDHKDCETACYRCLKSYQNQRFHEYLSWPLVMPDLEQLAAEPPRKTGQDNYDPRPWLEAYDQGCGSPLELRFLRLFEQNGIAVDKQVALAPEPGAPPISVADFVVQGTKKAIYIDGAAFHRGERLRRDRYIREKLKAGSMGWEILVFGRKDLDEPGQVVTRVKALTKDD